MFDIHAHLNFPELLKETEDIVMKSKKVGLRGIIIGSSSLDDSRIALDLAKKYSGFLYASVGIHPQQTDVDSESSIEEQLKGLEVLVKANSQKIVAIGETGFDFSEAPPGEKERSKKDQAELFLGQIELARKYKLPLIVHVRKANEEAISFLEIKAKENNGVIHCYSGGKKRVKRILALPGEWYFGFDGNLTYDQGLQNVLREIPKERVLTETDSPFLAPEPYRGEMARPFHTPLIVSKIAELWQEEKEMAARRLVRNTERLFTKLV